MKKGHLLPALAASAALALGVWTAPASAQDDGFYLGILGGVYLEDNSSGLTASKVVGFDLVTGNFVFGAEAELLGLLWQGSQQYGALAARARLGIMISDELLLYGTAGFHDWFHTSTYPTIGGGGEFMFNDSLSGRVDVQGILYGSETGLQARGGFVWHPY